MKKILALSSLLIALLIGCGNGEDQNTIPLSGTVETTNTILSSQVSGTVLRIPASEGEKINAGDTVVVIDAETYQIQLMQAEAQQNLANAQYNLLKKGARSEDVAQAKEALRQTEANYTSAKDDFTRMKILYENRSITKKQLEDTETRFVITQSQLNSAQQNFRKVQNIARPEELEQAHSAFEAAKANVKLLQKRVNDCYVLSPLTGQIVENYAEIGETVTPQSSLCKISNLGEVEVVVYVQEIDLGKVKPGQKAEVFSDSYKNKSYEGKVTYISPEAEFTPKNIQTKEERTKLVFAVKVKVPNPDYELKSGMPVDAIIYVNENTVEH